MKISNDTAFTSENQTLKIIGGIFRVRRDLVVAIKRRVLVASDLDVEEADLLLDLYGAAELGWQEPKAAGEGYVTFRELQSSLVHSPALLSRRVALLKHRGWIESCLLHKLKGYRGKIDKKMKGVRITPAGVKVIQPVYEKYCRLCDELLAGLPADRLRNVQEFLEGLLRKLRGEL